MRFRPLLVAVVVGAVVLAVPSDRGTPPAREDTVPGRNVVRTGVGGPLLCVAYRRTRSALGCASSATGDSSSHTGNHRQPTEEGGSR
jgi:hypothetical protein